MIAYPETIIGQIACVSIGIIIWLYLVVIAQVMQQRKEKELFEYLREERRRKRRFSLYGGHLDEPQFMKFWRTIHSILLMLPYVAAIYAFFYIVL